MVNLAQQYFTASAKRYPAKKAIHCAERSETYSDVDGRTNAIANHLRSTLVERGDLIPFFMRKSVNSIEALLAILKSDCAYVPIDTGSPANRIQAILGACEASLVIVDCESKSLFESLVPQEDRPQMLVIDEFSGGDTSERNYKNLSIDIAYVLFTSGSTGIPKGVMIPHKAIIDYIDWCVSEYGLNDNDVVANHAPLYFDNSTFDIYTAFKSGAQLHLVDDTVNAIIPSLVKWIRSRKITTFFCVPSVLSMLLRSRRLKPDSFPDLRHLICAGEVLPPDVLKVWMEMYPHIQFTNMYGPTEITVDCTFHVFNKPPKTGALAVPIGKARPNMELFVRLENGDLSQNIGARGELLVRGTSVAYGYLGDDEKTQQVFIQNPRNDVFSDILYCTGDLVEIDENGDLMFIGRSDDQIKYLGYRIELGEIEAALAAVDGIDEGVVVFNHAIETSEQAIGALVSSNSGLEPADIAASLNERLPSYMVPTVITLTDADFPQTPNGKYDRKAINSLVFEHPEE
jgi:amino acid adenylation domain-containing protein